MSKPLRNLDADSFARRLGGIGLVLILGVYFGLALSSARDKSVTIDELGHLPSGVYYLSTGDPRYLSLNPPLVNVLSALPVLFLNLAQPLASPPPTEDVFSFWPTGYHFLENHRADYLRIYAAARWAPISIVACLGVLLFFWARALAPGAPNTAGLLAASLVCFSPNVLAYARIVGTDTGTAFFIFLALFSFRKMLLRPTLGFVLLCGITLGLAQLSKFYALLLYPTLIGLTIAWHRLSAEASAPLRKLLSCTAAAFFVSLCVLNTGYLWSEVGLSLSDLTLSSSTLQGWRETALGRLPLPLPGGFVRAIDGQLVEVGSGIRSYLFGESFQGGRWYYYLALLAIKTPLALFVCFAMALALSFSRSKAGESRLATSELVLLLSFPLLLFFYLSLSNQRQLGTRALLSAVPFVQLWVAVTIARARSLRWPIPVASAATLWLLGATLFAHPNYLSYFNPTIGGSQNGYLYASDANIDIGQDLVQLSNYLEEADVEKIQLFYFGSVDPQLYGISYTVPRDYQLEPGLLAISVSLYRMEYPVFDHGTVVQMGPVDPKSLGEPIASIANSIHIYRVEPRP